MITVILVGEDGIVTGMAVRRLREQNKQRTFASIKQAAKSLFEQKGYEATTTREIAELAQIGTGTLFLYVKDKAELLILIYTDALKEIIASVFATLPEDGLLLDGLMHIFSSFFRFYERDLANARFFLKELLFYVSEQNDHRSFDPLNEHFVTQLAHLIQQAQERGAINQNINPHLAAHSFYALYFAAVTAWLGNILLSDLDVLDQLRAAFDLQIKGMLP
ncbi:TetR/AcrR family transcriptional regulator [Tengunoibacter tsumagoiensis]|uniref:HTH tetR-type domain-containing protein n=1 Tax=Tengunoibacter tsumagoiensis TaxID=2014871 RepID=A0A401ZYM8_9CHLR|nr:TetR/AcrR family transcriptional regulator [Tengunoibacter tsumagoiensis]GCE11940.1 hypothetical protein KTT_17990 [Tengunoibacter tsumagoiensis]